jgi:hypothetical protein
MRTVWMWLETETPHKKMGARNVWRAIEDVCLDRNYMKQTWKPDPLNYRICVETGRMPK